MEIRVNRDGKERSYSVKLADEKGMRKLVADRDRDILDLLGATLEEIDPQTADQLGIEGGLRVTELDEGLLKSQTDIREGFIITGINHQNVKSERDVRKALEDSRGGVLVQGIYQNYPGELYYAFGLPG